ncbi:hypothetical protein J6590_037236 [Homalodisca vitripennis]|nr:hypothetical protein J6590_037236 [Homalodisca vitripennis]
MEKGKFQVNGAVSFFLSHAERKSYFVINSTIVITGQVLGGIAQRLFSRARTTPLLTVWAARVKYPTPQRIKHPLFRSPPKLVWLTLDFF